MIQIWKYLFKFLDTCKESLQIKKRNGNLFCYLVKKKEQFKGRAKCVSFVFSIMNCSVVSLCSIRWNSFLVTQIEVVFLEFCSWFTFPLAPWKCSRWALSVSYKKGVLKIVHEHDSNELVRSFIYSFIQSFSNDIILAQQESRDARTLGSKVSRDQAIKGSKSQRSKKARTLKRCIRFHFHLAFQLLLDYLSDISKAFDFQFHCAKQSKTIARRYQGQYS